MRYSTARQWVSEHKFVILFVVFVVFLANTYRVEADNRQRDKQEALDRDFTACKSGADVRLVIRDLITTSASSSTSRLNLETLPNFEKLDPVTQAYMVEIDKVLHTDASPEQKQALLDKVPVRDCEREYPGHTKEK